MGHFSLPRWIRQLSSPKLSCHDGDSGNGGDHGFNSIECYACTQVGVPVFHSTSCDGAHRPEWEAAAGSSLVPIQNRNQRSPSVHRRSSPSGTFGRVLDPRSERVQRWNRGFLLARTIALAVDPLFFYALSIRSGGGGTPCLYMDGGLTAVVTVLRTFFDAVHLFHMWLQLRLAYVSRESLVVGCGKLVWDPSAIASHYVHSLKGFWFDFFVILPVPQAVFCLLLPKLLIREEKAELITTILLLIFLFQFLPRAYHSIYLTRRMQKVTGYIFGTIRWGFGLNLMAYFIASQVAGGCWYVLAIQRIASCMRKQCERSGSCNLSSSCFEDACYQFQLAAAGNIGDPCSSNSSSSSAAAAGGGVRTRVSICLDVNGPYNYGIYQWALPVISSNSIAVKILYPIFWGLMSLSTFGNILEPTSHWLEVIFSICTVLSGLLLFTLLIGNIQGAMLYPFSNKVFLHAVMERKRKMQLRFRDLEWWMRRRQLPSPLKQRVRHYEKQNWAAMGGEDEMDLIKHLPEGLRRDIKRHLCLELIKKVPLFHILDDLILDNICDRLKPLVFSNDEKIIREGDPVRRMVFVVNGRIKRSQCLSNGTVATSTLESGGFLGDELLSWCLRRPFMDRLPASSATFICLVPVEAFELEAGHLRYITDHFRYRFANESLKRTARYYSSNWRTWAAVNIQFAWRRYKRRSGGNGSTLRERRLLRYAAMFMSIRPHDHLE